MIVNIKDRHLLYPDSTEQTVLLIGAHGVSCITARHVQGTLETPKLVPREPPPSPTKDSHFFLLRSTTASLRRARRLLYNTDIIPHGGSIHYMHWSGEVGERRSVGTKRMAQLYIQVKQILPSKIEQSYDHQIP